MQHERGLDHFHRRIRGKKKLTKHNILMDKLIYIIVILGPLFTIPQVIQIFSNQDASGVSIFSWGAYSVGAFFWLSYGISHKEKPIILTNILWILMNLLVMYGAIMYG